MGKFSDAELQGFKLELQTALHARCPFCGGDLVLGYRKENGNLALLHSLEPEKPSLIPGCETFQRLIHEQPAEFFRLLRSRGTQFARIAG